MVNVWAYYYVNRTKKMVLCTINVDTHTRPANWENWASPNPRYSGQVHYCRNRLCAADHVQKEPEASQKWKPPVLQQGRAKQEESLDAVTAV